MVWTFAFFGPYQVLAALAATAAPLAAKADDVPALQPPGLVLQNPEGQRVQVSKYRGIGSQIPYP